MLDESFRLSFAFVARTPRGGWVFDLVPIDKTVFSAFPPDEGMRSSRYTAGNMGLARFFIMIMIHDLYTQALCAHLCPFPLFPLIRTVAWVFLRGRLCIRSGRPLTYPSLLIT